MPPVWNFSRLCLVEELDEKTSIVHPVLSSTESVIGYKTEFVVLFHFALRTRDWNLSLSVLHFFLLRPRQLLR